MCVNYSREETIQGRKLYEEIRYTDYFLWSIMMGWIFGTLEQNQKSTDEIKMHIINARIFGTLEQN